MQQIGKCLLHYKTCTCFIYETLFRSLEINKFKKLNNLKNFELNIPITLVLVLEKNTEENLARSKAPVLLHFVQLSRRFVSLSRFICTLIACRGVKFQSSNVSGRKVVHGSAKGKDGKGREKERKRREREREN